jgi:(p)ppGpp synthase/HD superfamily hydrolase
MLDKAIALAATKFEGVFDKGGKPYILHCLWVMDRVRHLGDKYMIVAVLHDIVEDTDVSLEMLMELGYSMDIVDAIDALTKDSNLSYATYITGVKKVKIARQVKLRDLEHNSKITRLKGVSNVDVERMRKYNRAYLYLKNLDNENY